jgi:hypothetical protein
MDGEHVRDDGEHFFEMRGAACVRELKPETPNSELVSA